MEPVHEKSDAKGGDGMFPNGFLWGTAISSYQVEGGNDEWSDWGDWKTRAGKACDFRNRYEEYLDLAKALGTNALRFSIEWGRVEPQPGKWNREELAYYNALVQACFERKLDPLVTLWHISLPKWFAANGGWTNHDMASRFLVFASKIQEALAGKVRRWAILNEPCGTLSHKYITGDWPPGEKSAMLHFLAARRNLIEAHRRAYALMKQNDPSSEIGVALGISFDEPARPNHLGDKLLASASRMFGDFGFLKAISPDLDFIGLNYYFHNRLKLVLDPAHYFFERANENKAVSDLGWEVFPAGLTEVLTRLHRDFGKPLIVTENGIADSTDAKRPEFLAAHARAIADAISRGADVRGYFYWSLMDNFEWAHGFGPRFGLYGMDYEKMQPYERGSCGVYRDLIKELSQN